MQVCILKCLSQRKTKICPSLNPIVDLNLSLLDQSADFSEKIHFKSPLTLTALDGNQREVLHPGH